MYKFDKLCEIITEIEKIIEKSIIPEELLEINSTEITVKLERKDEMPKITN